MLKKSLSLLTVLLLVACGGNESAKSNDGHRNPTQEDQIRIGQKDYIVKVKNQSLARVRGPLALRGVKGSLRVRDNHAPANLLKVNLTAEDKIQQLFDIMKSPDVEYVVEDFKLHRFEAPFDTQTLREQWAIRKVNAQEAWDRAGNQGSRDILVAVIDTGVDYNHESLRANMVPGDDFAGNDGDPMDDTGPQNPGHGTHCAGIIGATGTANNGTIGIAPNIRMMPLRFLDENGSGDLMNGIRAIDYAIEQGAHVISASWGASVGGSQAQPLIEAVQRASEAGVVFVAAAANNGDDNDETAMYPANATFENTITVAASGSNDEKPAWSNYGEHKVHIASPGLDIMSTLPNNTYDNLSGTSMATPLVAGMVALLMSQNPDLSGRDAKSIMQITGAKVDIETACHCRVDAAASMDFLLSDQVYVSPHLATIQPNESIQFDLVNANGAVTFSSANPGVATIDNTGVMQAVSEGETRITAVDANGTEYSSSRIFVRVTNEQVACPLGDQFLCMFMCIIDPSMPWCE